MGPWSLALTCNLPPPSDWPCPEPRSCLGAPGEGLSFQNVPSLVTRRRPRAVSRQSPRKTPLLGSSQASSRVCDRPGAPPARRMCLGCRPRYGTCPAPQGPVPQWGGCSHPRNGSGWWGEWERGRGRWRPATDEAGRGVDRRTEDAWMDRGADATWKHRRKTLLAGKLGPGMGATDRGRAQGAPCSPPQSRGFF